jgi:ascorbate PTS system EIIA or EIIAB component
MLKELVEGNRCQFLDRVESWQEAIRISCRPLVDNGIVDQSYGDELIENVNTHGPYIVLMPGLAMPHTMEGSERAKGTGISFMKLKEPVHFDPNDPEKDAVVFFTLAAADSEAHLNNMRCLCKMLSNEELLAELMTVSSTAELLQLHEKYCIEFESKAGE